MILFDVLTNAANCLSGTIGIVSGPIIEYAVSIGLDVVKDRMKGAREEKEIKKRLYQLFDDNSRLQLELTEQEQNDFPILIQYIKDELMEDIKTRLFEGNKNERREARERISVKVIRFTEEHPSISEKNAKNFVRSVIDMLRKFFRQKVNRDFLIAIAEIEDSVENIVYNDGEKTRKLISTEVAEIKEVIEDKSLSIESAIDLVKSGDFAKLKAQYDTWNKAVSSAHVLFPYYGIGFNEKNQPYSRPLHKEAIELYPPTIQFESESIKINGTPVPHLSNDILEKAYRHQYEITFNVKTAKKMLGDVMDPIQEDVKFLEGVQMVAKPKKFPPAAPYSVLINGEIVVPYLLLRLIEILDDDTYIFTNDEQTNFAFHVKIRMNFEKETLHFSIIPNSPSTKETLACLKFFEKLQTKSSVELKELNINETVVRAEWQIEEKELLRNYVALYERIVDIEEYFSCKFDVPELPDNDDIESVYFLHALITKGITGTWKDSLVMDAIISENLKDNIELLRPANSIMTCSIQEKTIFNRKIMVPICYTFESATLKNSEKLKKKLEVCDLGEVIKIEYISAGKSGIGEYKAAIDKEKMKELYNNEASV